MIDEIAAASEEQAQGIDQINKAVSEMDKVTQQTAANAEESASASEELTAQAEQMKGYVSDLEAVIGGRRDGNAAGARRSAPITREAGGRTASPSHDCRATRCARPEAAWTGTDHTPRG